MSKEILERIEKIEWRLGIIGDLLKDVMDEKNFRRNMHRLFIIEKGWGNEETHAFYKCTEGCSYDSPSLSSVISCVNRIKARFDFDDKQVCETIGAFRHMCPGLAEVYNLNVKEDYSFPEHVELIDMLTDLNPERLVLQKIEQINQKVNNSDFVENESLMDTILGQIVNLYELVTSPSPDKSANDEKACDIIQEILNQLRSH